jgi:broad specificity phosphatase PhoE
MKSIWIIRHGYREDYDNRNYASENIDRPNDPGLTVHGKQQAEETAEFIAKEHASITTVFSSPFLRTLQTSQAIAEKINAKIVIEGKLQFVI